MGIKGNKPALALGWSAVSYVRGVELYYNYHAFCRPMETPVDFVGAPFVGMPLDSSHGGIVLLLFPHNRFTVSAVTAWIFNGPLLPALSENNLSLQQFHHLVSAAVLFVILYHLREM